MRAVLTVDPDAWGYVTAEEMEREVVHWVTDPCGYFAYTADGAGLAIVRSLSIQLAIEDPLDYHTWLWLETVQGFFLARQRFVEFAPGGWWLVRRFEPGASEHFFHEFGERLPDWLVAATLA